MKRELKMTGDAEIEISGISRRIDSFEVKTEDGRVVVSGKRITPTSNDIDELMGQGQFDVVLELLREVREVKP